LPSYVKYIFSKEIFYINVNLKNERDLALLFSLLMTIKPFEPVPFGLDVSTPVSNTVHELSPCS